MRACVHACVCVHVCITPYASCASWRTLTLTLVCQLAHRASVEQLRGVQWVMRQQPDSEGPLAELMALAQEEQGAIEARTCTPPPPPHTLMAHAHAHSRACTIGLSWWSGHVCVHVCMYVCRTRPSAS